MKLTLTHDEMRAYCAELHDANAILKSNYPADSFHSFHRQPVHTVFGGANLFKARFAAKLGEVALLVLDTYESFTASLPALWVCRALKPCRRESPSTNCALVRSHYQYQ